jgi:ATP-binding cassette subfamily F protein 3
VLDARNRESVVDAETGITTPIDRRAQKRAEAEARQKLSEARRPLQQKIDRIEKEIAALSAEKQSLDAWLATPEAYAEEQKAKLKVALARQGDLAWQLARDETQWLELQEALERVSV